MPESLGQPFLDYDSRLLFDEGILKLEIVNSRTISSAYLRNDVINYFEKYERYYSKLISQKNRRNETIIYWEKIDSKLHKFIQSYMKEYNENYVRVDRYFGDFYMTLLANRISRKKGLSLITDEPVISKVSVELSSDNDTRGQRIPYRKSFNRETITKLSESILANISLRQVGVTRDTDTKKIIKFRSKYRDYIANYRNEVKSLIEHLEIDKHESLEALESSVNTIVDDRIIPSLNDLKKALNDERIKTLIAPLSIAGAIGVGSSFLLNPGVTIGVSAVVITSQAVLSKRRTNAILRNNKYSFLQLVEDKL